MGFTLIYMNPFAVVEQFEKAIAEYTGAPWAVACDSCTNAIFLCLKWLEWAGKEKPRRVIIPSETYLSVPMAIWHAGYDISFDPRMNNWTGEYQLNPLPVWDSARRLRRGMYRVGQFQCLSFHTRKHLPIGKGGMILTDSVGAATWLKRARYEGRGPMPYKDDDITFMGWNMYMTPEQAARGLALLQQLPDNNPDLPEPEGYRDLRTFSVFKNIPTVI